MKKLHTIHGLSLAILSTVLSLSGTIVHAQSPNTQDAKILSVPAPSYEKNQVPYETRIFYLKYATAEDQTIQTLEGPEIIPGLASTLRKIMGAQVGNENANIESDGATNKLIIRDTPAAMGTYEALINGLDIKQQSIKLIITVADVSTHNSNNNKSDIFYTRENLEALFQSKPEKNLDESNPARNAISYANSDLILKELSSLEKAGFAEVKIKNRIVTLEGLPAIIDNRTSFNTEIKGQGEPTLFVQKLGYVLQTRTNIIRDKDEISYQIQFMVSNSELGDTSSTESPVINQLLISANAKVKSGQSLIVFGQTVGKQSKLPVSQKSEVILQVRDSGTNTNQQQYVTRISIITPILVNAPEPKTTDAAPISAQKDAAS
jgi:hypothetical protein